MGIFETHKAGSQTQECSETPQQQPGPTLKREVGPARA